MSPISERESQTPVWAGATVGLFVLAVGYTLYLASDVLVPIAFAILLNQLLSPLVRRMDRIGIVPRISAAMIMLALVGLVGLAIATLAEPAEQWLAEVPKTVRELKSQMIETKGKFAEIQELAEEVEEIASVESSNAPQSVVVEGPGILEGVLGGLPYIITGAAVVIFLTYFLLASGDGMLRRLTQCARTWTSRRRIVTIAREIQNDLSVYLGTVTIINMSLGALAAGILYLLEFPNPVLWGTMIGALNFAPYVGALVSTLVLTVVGLTNYETVGQGLTAPIAIFFLTTLEGQVITPSILGSRMSLNPTMVFISVLIWGWLWGVAGALMAVPIMTSMKVWCDHMPAQQHLSAFLRSDSWQGHEKRPYRQPRKPKSTINMYPEGGR